MSSLLVVNHFSNNQSTCNSKLSIAFVDVLLNCDFGIKPSSACKAATRRSSILHRYKMGLQAEFISIRVIVNFVAIFKISVFP